jgi:beta-phosphoglucomutase-like phosphatase (HAD superfamily)
MEALAYIRNKGLPAAVATSTERGRAEAYLETANVLSFFDTVVYGDEIEKSKPAPDIFLEAARRSGCPPSECLVLEDSESGLKAAAAAGMRSVFIQDIKRPSADVLNGIYREADSLLELPEIIKELIEE